MKQEQLNVRSIRPFIGATDYLSSIDFYKTIGFEVKTLSHNMSLCIMDGQSFYLQDYAVKDWIDNTMLFLEVDHPKQYYDFLKSLDLTRKFPNVKLKEMVYHEWGKEFFLHDPSNILWHIGCFDK